MRGLVVALVVAASAWTAAAWGAGTVKLHVIDVGQGDGLILECPDGKIGMVVDSADPFEEKTDGVSGVSVWQKYIGDHLPATTTVPLVVASHPHADHIGGLSWLLRRNKVTLVVDDGRSTDSDTYKDYADARDHGGKVKAYKSIDKVTAPIKLCSSKVKVTLFVPAGETDDYCASNPNRCSVVARIDYSKTSFLLMGDAEKEEEGKLLADPKLAKLLDVDVLKVGHHGSHSSSSPDFLKAVSPKCAVISSGNYKTSTKNAGGTGYHHPRTVTLDALDDALPADQTDRHQRIKAYDATRSKWVDKKVKVGLWDTARDGTIVVGSDGTAVTCNLNAPADPAPTPPPAPPPAPAPATQPSPP